MKMKVNQENLLNDVLWLTSTFPHRNFWNPDVLAEIASQLHSRFEKMGYATQQQTFTADGETYQNVIATIGEPEAERIILSAHYDVCGEIVGADVNASGVAGILELARLISSAKLSLPYRIEFALYCLTEPPFFGTELMGSTHHIAQLQAEKAQIHSMLALSGIGYFSDEPDSQEYPIAALTAKHPAVGNFIGISCLSAHSEWFRALYNSMQSTTKVPVELLAYPNNNDNVGISDHRCFLRKGYRAAMIGNGGVNRNPNYHQIPDTIETLDFSRMAETVQCLYQYLAQLT